GELRARARDRLHDAAGHGVIAAHRDGSCAGRVDAAIELGDALDACFVVVGLGEGDVAESSNAARTPGIELERHVHPARHRGHVAHRAWSKVLVALGGAVAGGMRDADQGDVAAAWIAIERAAKQRGDVPRIQSLDHHLVAGGKLYRGHGAGPPGVVRTLSHMARRRALEKRTKPRPTRWSAGGRFCRAWLLRATSGCGQTGSRRDAEIPNRTAFV